MLWYCLGLWLNDVILYFWTYAWIYVSVLDGNDVVYSWSLGGGNWWHFEEEGNYNVGASLVY